MVGGRKEIMPMNSGVIASSTRPAPLQALPRTNPVNEGAIQQRTATGMQARAKRSVDARKSLPQLAVPALPRVLRRDCPEALTQRGRENPGPEQQAPCTSAHTNPLLPHCRNAPIPESAPRTQVHSKWLRVSTSSHCAHGSALRTRNRRRLTRRSPASSLLPARCAIAPSPAHSDADIEPINPADSRCPKPVNRLNSEFTALCEIVARPTAVRSPSRTNQPVSISRNPPPQSATGSSSTSHPRRATELTLGSNPSATSRETTAVAVQTISSTALPAANNVAVIALVAHWGSPSRTAKYKTPPNAVDRRKCCKCSVGVRRKEPR